MKRLLCIVLVVLAGCGRQDAAAQKAAFDQAMADTDLTGDSYAGESLIRLQRALREFRDFEQKYPDSSQMPEAENQIQHLKELVRVFGALKNADDALNANNPDLAQKQMSAIADQVNAQSNSEVYFKFEKAIEAKRISLSPPVEFGNGIAFKKVTLQEFSSKHSDAHCFDLEGQKACEGLGAIQSDCPGAICTDVTYTFKNETLSGFIAHYAEPEWSAILAATTKKYGEAKTSSVEATVDFPMSSRTFEWALHGGVLSMTHFSGVDVRGNPVQHPYSIIFSTKK